MRICGTPKLSAWWFAEAFLVLGVVTSIVTSTYQKSHMKPSCGFFGKWKLLWKCCTITQYHKWHVLIWYLGNIDRLEQVLPGKVYPAKKTSNGRKVSITACLEILVPSSPGHEAVECFMWEGTVQQILPSNNVGLYPRNF